MRAFNWLHLTDLHFRLDEKAPLWPNVRDALFADLERLHQESGPWHAVLFTGDLVQSGSKDEFDALEEKVLGPLFDHLAQLGSNAPVLLTVPGNHDLTRPDVKKQSAALRQLLRKDGFHEIADEFWNEPQSEYREIISRAFTNYQSWVHQNDRNKNVRLTPGLLPGDFAATIKIQSSNGADLRIGIAGINTTFLQLANGDFTRRLSFHVKQLHLACEQDIPAWAKSHDACILMTHQGPNWFDTASSKDVYCEVNPAGRFAVHLFGHMHETALRSSSVGGGDIVRQWQGTSLFGLEKFGEPPQFDRRHGYGAGRIEFDTDVGIIRHWPRRAVKDANGWRFIPDHDACILEDNGNSTVPERLKGPAIVSIGQRSLKGRQSTKGRSGSPSVQPTLTPSEAEWPAQCSDLREYCEAIVKAHSHIKFVEVPLQKDLTPVQLDSLFVEPRFASQEIHPDLHPTMWPRTVEAVEALREHRILVVLGDPGSGKSTLVSCLAWQLCRPKPERNSPWVREFGGCIPIPIVLRELRLKMDVTWEGLVEAFLHHHIGRLIPNRSFLEDLFRSGRAIILLDGLDEIGNLTVRRRLKQAVQSGIATFNDCRWVLTSRIVGYDAVPFHTRHEDVAADAVIDGEVVSSKGKNKTVSSEVAEVIYLSPFSDEQIKRFATNWYSQHEPDPTLVEQTARDFVDAIGENHGTRRLARIPYLLTLMALIHHKNSTLPHGRTELYERIATAYLEQIDLRRHLDQLPYSLLQKRRWLAEVAYRMQLQRSKGSNGNQASQILATEAAVKRWLRDAMKASSAQGTKEEVDSLLDYFGKRSGLLLPRGEGMFAFMHLSLQEYFASCFIEPRLTASRFSLAQLHPEPTDEELKSWANHEAWREAFVLLFEMVSQKSVAETEGFLSHLFKSRLEGDASLKEMTAAGLLAEISTDPFVFLKAETRRRCIQTCWRWVLRQKKRNNQPPNSVVRSLLRATNGDLQKSWNAGSISKKELKSVEILDLSGCRGIRDLSPLSALPRLRALYVRDCVTVTDFAPIARLKQLEVLHLDGCDVSSLVPVIGELRTLTKLFLGGQIDLGLLGNFDALRELHLHYPEASQTDLTPLAHLERLDLVCVHGNHPKINDALRRSPEAIKSEGLRTLLRESAQGAGSRRFSEAAARNSRSESKTHRRKTSR